MLEFLKRFGLGILYVLIGPFLIVFLLFWSLANIGIFIVELFKGIKSFFKGKKFFDEFPEDVEARRILSIVPYDNPENDNTAINVATIDDNKEGKNE